MKDTRIERWNKMVTNKIDVRWSESTYDSFTVLDEFHMSGSYLRGSLRLNNGELKRFNIPCADIIELNADISNNTLREGILKIINRCNKRKQQGNMIKFDNLMEALEVLVNG